MNKDVSVPTSRDTIKLRIDTETKDALQDYCEIHSTNITNTILNQIENLLHVEGERKKYWSISVLERDDYTCQKCGSQENLHAHHIIPVSKDKSRSLDINNGITLCKECHKEKHAETKNTMKYLLDIDDQLHTEMKLHCIKNKISMNKFICNLIKYNITTTPQDTQNQKESLPPPEVVQEEKTIVTEQKKKDLPPPVEIQPIPVSGPIPNVESVSDAEGNIKPTRAEIREQVLSEGYTGGTFVEVLNSRCKKLGII